MTSVAIWLGTLILYLPAPPGAYVTADSRHDGGDPAQRDQARKIFLCGPAAVCAISGGLRIEAAADGRRETLDLAAALARQSQPADVESLAFFEQVRVAMAADIAAFWTRNLANRRTAAPMSLRLGSPSLCAILIAARSSGGALALAQIAFPFTERRLEDGTWMHELLEPIVRLADPARPLAQGRPDCMRAAPAAGEVTLEAIDALYARTQEVEFCRALIGGPVDVAMIDESEARWLRRKPLPPPEKVDQPLPLAVH